MKFTLFALAALGCSPNPACAPESELAAIEASYQAELVDRCSAYMPANPPSECPGYEEVTERARRARERWAACQR